MVGRRVSFPIEQLVDYINENLSFLTFEELQGLKVNDPILFEAAQHIFLNTCWKYRNAIYWVLRRNTAKIEEKLFHFKNKVVFSDWSLSPISYINHNSPPNIRTSTPIISISSDISIKDSSENGLLQNKLSFLDTNFEKYISKDQCTFDTSRELASLGEFVTYKDVSSELENISFEAESLYRKRFKGTKYKFACRNKKYKIKLLEEVWVLKMHF